MSLGNLFKSWWHELRRERLQAFGRFLWQRFLDDRCFETAGALSYTTVFALVPLSVVVFGILSAFPVFQEWTNQLTHFIFSNFVPAAARTVEDYLLQFAEGADRLTLPGMLALIVSAALTLNGIETTFNRIWRVDTPRPPLVRFLVYWTVLTLGTLLVAASVALTSYLYAVSLRTGVDALGVGERLLRLAPVGVELLVFTLAYMIVPNRPVALRHGLAGGVLATALFELAKFAFGLYLRNVPSYQIIYGTLAVVPIFLIWVYLCWIVVLLGAIFAAALSTFRFLPKSLRLPEGYELYGLLRLLGRLREAQASGRAMSSEDLDELEPSLTDERVQRMLGLLDRLDVVEQTVEGHWVLSRDLDQLPLAELYEAGHLRVPVEPVDLPRREDSLGRAAIATIDRLRHALEEDLSRPVGRILEDVKEKNE